MAEGRPPYPRDEKGLPISPAGIGECYEECRLPDPGQNRHHLSWPREKHREAVQRHYREAGCMVVQACKCKHADLHATYRPPSMPDRFAMIDVADGDITPTVAEVFIRRRDA